MEKSQACTLKGALKIRTPEYITAFSTMGKAVYREISVFDHLYLLITRVCVDNKPDDLIPFMAHVYECYYNIVD